MRYLARTTEGRPLLGDDEGFVPLGSVHPACSSVRDALPLATDGTLGSPDDATADRVSPDHLSFGPPLAAFGTLWGIGLNYADHAADLSEHRPDEPASFLRPSRSLTGPGGPIRLPPRTEAERVTAEAELAVLLGRECHGVDADAVSDVVAGYLPVIDVTAEDVLQRNPRFLTRAKSYDGFLVVGSAIAVPDEPFELGHRTVRTVKNGDVAAEADVDGMLFSPAELVAFHSTVTTFQPGDLLSTGTPGATRVTPGDEVRAAVEGVGHVDARVVR